MQALFCTIPYRIFHSLTPGGHPKAYGNSQSRLTKWGWSQGNSCSLRTALSIGLWPMAFSKYCRTSPPPYFPPPRAGELEFLRMLMTPKASSTSSISFCAPSAGRGMGDGNIFHLSTDFENNISIGESMVDKTGRIRYPILDKIHHICLHSRGNFLPDSRPTGQLYRKKRVFNAGRESSSRKESFEECIHENRPATDGHSGPSRRRVNGDGHRPG